MEGAALRQLEPQWNKGMITASIAVSLLGAFTTTQLMCQARTSVQFSSVLIWTVLGSLTFGFCSIWSLHFVAMLAYELDLPIGINVPMTILSSVLAVLFTFVALATDLLWETLHWKRRRRKRGRKKNKRRESVGEARMSAEAVAMETEGIDTRSTGPDEDACSDLEGGSENDELLQDAASEPSSIPTAGSHSAAAAWMDRTVNGNPEDQTPVFGQRHPVAYEYSEIRPGPAARVVPVTNGHAAYKPRDSADSHAETSRVSSTFSESHHSSSFTIPTFNSHGVTDIVHIAQRSTAPAKNAFIFTGEALFAGCTRRNILKGFLWSLAITGMHYVGIAALRIPDGYIVLHPPLVVLSALISWSVCLVGIILVSRIETHLAQQFLFGTVASTGVAAMHFTGMVAVTFWSYAPPSESRGYPSALAAAIVTIAITTCIASNFLLAHVATISRNKLAEIVVTRKELWRTIALKENAEQAAAAKSDFIASASHEIRTPLHHLQGYSDLLSRTKLTEEGRLLLYAIQHATKTLSMITNNVLDWSKLERHADMGNRPVSLDMRSVCESILMLLPNRDDADDVDLMVVVSPDVPHSLFLDEMSIHRILMNLVSNALKFTRSGYILLLIEMNGEELQATVEDTGLGIPATFLPELFEPFTQAQTRGSQRGTGLGLSIIKQLLHRMQGTVQVESFHQDTPGIGPEQTGSKFTVTIPVPDSRSSDVTEGEVPNRLEVAIFPCGSTRAVQGLCTSWQHFGYEVTTVHEFADLTGTDWKYVWVDLLQLIADPPLLDQLTHQRSWTVLVSYNTQESLKQVPEIQSAPNFVMLQKPLIWHSFEERIAANQGPTNNILTKAVTFAPTVEILDRDIKTEEEPPSADTVVLLVEDNPINQRLGKKMLTALGYRVMTADDGEHALEQVKAHNGSIDIILMDQSMPRKDGVVATKEIREMEAQGALAGRTPIIAVTAVVSAEAQGQFKAAGADDFLTKPLSLDRLDQTLKVYVPANREAI